MNPFKINDKVKTVDNKRQNGTVKYIACNAATNSGGKSCDKKQCLHFVKDFVWVEWSDGKLYSYIHTELGFESVVVPTEIMKVEESNGIPSSKDLCIPPLKEKEDKFFDYRLYNGFSQVRYTREGKPVIVDVLDDGIVPTIIKDDELDFDVYIGKKQGSIRKK